MSDALKDADGADHEREVGRDPAQGYKPVKARRYKTVKV